MCSINGDPISDPIGDPYGETMARASKAKTILSMYVFSNKYVMSIIKNTGAKNGA